MLVNGKPIRFIHIEKSGGTSVTRYLVHNNIDFLLGKNTKRVKKHSHASMFENEDSFKFCMVRNPYTRLVSFYNYTAKKIFNCSFEHFVKNHLFDLEKSQSPQTMKIYKPIKDRLLANNIKELEDCFDWNTCLVDKIFYLENLQEFYNFVGIQEPLPQENKSTYDDPMSYYTQELKEIVADHFRKDFEILEYKI